MSNTQQPKPDPKGKAIASFVLGIISLIINIDYAAYSINLRIPEILNWIGELILTPLLTAEKLIPLWIILLLILLLLPTSGLILGIKGLKSTKKKLSIVGIILSIISLLLGAYPALLIYSASLLL